MSLELIKNYEEAKQKIYEHVGFEEDFVVCPLDDCTEYFWLLEDDSVSYSLIKEDLSVESLDNGESEELYKDDIYTQRFYKKHVYEGKDFTMVFCDPHTDGMKWFRLFDNSKRITNP